ncbi:hypothetical protein [Phocaeicola plebeius]|uniref:hypothetical protein n=1 Tax=Phocaeicola plebeius TaxID=310297 RepID=UPI0035646467
MNYKVNDNMSYLQVVHYKPVLAGYIRVNGRLKYGTFMPEWSKYSNSMIYSYHTTKGNKGTGGFTLDRAYNLFKGGALKLKEQTIC